MSADVGLGGRREQRRREAFRFAQAGREGNAVCHPGFLVFRPGRAWLPHKQRDQKGQATRQTCKIPPYDGLERHNLGFANKHRTAFELCLVFVGFCGHRVDVRCDEMVWDDVRELGEPEA